MARRESGHLLVAKSPTQLQPEPAIFLSDDVFNETHDCSPVGWLKRFLRLSFVDLLVAFRSLRHTRFEHGVDCLFLGGPDGIMHRMHVAMRRCGVQVIESLAYHR
jgi:hypothetical protein